MRYLAIALMVASPFAWADAATEKFDPAQFEKRFHDADKDKKGKLSREEAYGEFPRMPEFFDEIDTNKDGFITLKEVNNAMERRVNAAINTSKPATRYGSVDAGKEVATGVGESARQDPVFTSEAEERRYRRFEFYESIGDDKVKAIERGEPVPTTPSSPILVKPF
ncbi:MAG: hypothetical protein WA635_12665 [Gallionella sp.]